MARLVAHGLGRGDPALDGGGLGGAALQVVLDGRPGLAADDLAVAGEEAALGFGRVARRWGSATVGLGAAGLVAVRRFVDLDRLGGPGLRTLGLLPGVLALPFALGVAVGHQVGVHGREGGGVALVELEVGRARRL